MTLRKMVNCTWVWIAFYQHFKPSGSKNRTVWHYSFGKVHSIIGGQLELEQSLAISIGHQIIKDVHLSNLKIICQNISSSLLLLCVNAGQVLLCPKIYCSSLIFQNPSKMASLTKTPKQRLFWTPTKNTAEDMSMLERMFWIVHQRHNHHRFILSLLRCLQQLTDSFVSILILGRNWNNLLPSSSIAQVSKAFWRRQNKVTALYLCILINALIFLKLMWLLMMQMCRPKITVVWDDVF